MSKDEELYEDKNREENIDKNKDEISKFSRDETFVPFSKDKISKLTHLDKNKDEEMFDFFKDEELLEFNKIKLTSSEKEKKDEFIEESKKIVNEKELTDVSTQIIYEEDPGVIPEGLKVYKKGNLKYIKTKTEFALWVVEEKRKML